MMPQVNKKKNDREDHPFPASFPYILCKRFVITYEVRRTTEKTTEYFLYVHSNNRSFVKKKKKKSVVFFFSIRLPCLPTYQDVQPVIAVCSTSQVVIARLRGTPCVALVG